MEQRPVFDGEVTHLSSQGYGVVPGEGGSRYFVRGVWPGDKGRFYITDEREERYRFAELLELHSPSPDRQTPACPYAGYEQNACGGCPWSIASYAAQLSQKQHRVRYALNRAGFVEPPMGEIWPAPSEYGYRSRAQFKTDGQVIGYAARQGKGIVPIDHCLVLSPKLDALYQEVRASLPREDFRPTSPHIWSFLELDEESELSALSPNRRRAFAQANRHQNSRMRLWIAERLRPRKDEFELLELFAGSGNFTEVLVPLGYQRIVALEVADSAVQALQAKAWDGVETFRENLYHPRIGRRLFHLAGRVRSLLLNPPRAGLLQLANILMKHLPHLDRIVYVSCDPQTLAQDLRTFHRAGFVLEEVQALDQMPHTAHIETLVSLHRRL